MAEDQHRSNPHDAMHEAIRDSMSLDGDAEKLSNYYRDWAETYDDDVASHGYGLPSMMVRTVESALTARDPEAQHLDRSIRVVDAGCGTGLVGAALCDAGFDDLHGVDLSEEMIQHAARRGVYSSLMGAVDLSNRVPDELRGSADLVTAGGVFTVGHAPPSALETMASIARPLGVLVVSTREAYLESTNFVNVAEQLERKGLLRLLLRIEDAPYTNDSNGDYWGFEVRDIDAAT